MDVILTDDEDLRDDLDDIPLSKRKTVGGTKQELVDIWFFFLGTSVGLILIHLEPDTSKVEGFAKENIRRIHSLPSGSVLSVRTFRRVGVFTGFNGPRTRHDHLETVELI